MEMVGLPSGKTLACDKSEAPPRIPCYVLIFNLDLYFAACSK